MLDEYPSYMERIPYDPVLINESFLGESFAMIKKKSNLGLQIILSCKEVYATGYELSSKKEII